MTADPIQADELARMETEALPGSGGALRPAALIGPYQIQGVLGRGGIGIVYRAKVVASCSVPVGEEVALKVLSSQHFDDEDRRRFEREAAYLQALRHPNLLRILDVGEDHGRPYLVMQLIKGKTLDELLREQAGRGKAPVLSERRTVDFAIQALEALHVAHLGGILHRDLKPNNLMVTKDGTIKILDFGLAQRLDTESRLTASGSVLGTPAYMSPEQASGTRDMLSPRSDVYSMGAVCYELLTGRQPFTAENSIAVLRRILEEELTPPSHYRPELSRDLETVILTAMDKDPRRRHSNAEAMAEDLRRFREGLPVRARRVSALQRIGERLWRERRLLAIVGLVLFVLAIASTVIVRQLVHRVEQRGQQIQENVQREYQELLEAKWIEHWRYDGVLDAELRRELLDSQSHADLAGAEIFSLPPVTSNARIALEVAKLGGDGVLELSLSDDGAGAGYTLELRCEGEGSDQLTLYRGRPESHDSVRTLLANAEIEANRRFRLSFARIDDMLHIDIDGDAVMPPRLDLAPVEGLENDGVSIAYTPESLAISDIVLERQRPPERVSRLKVADIVRHSGRYRRALRMYENFLRDFPDSDDARDARYRIGLCLLAMEEYQRAQDEFMTVAEESADEPEYAIPATFKAWECAMRDGRFDDSVTLFDTIRAKHELEALLTAVPADTLQSLASNYYDRGLSLADRDPDTALRLFSTAIDIGEYLQQWRVVHLSRIRSGDLLCSLGRISDAIARYEKVTEKQHAHDNTRLMSMLKRAEAERLRRRDDVAMAAYRAVMDAEPGDPIQRQWARLWLGDLLLHDGDRSNARRLWGASEEHESQPGRIMHHLLLVDEPMSMPDDRYYRNDIAYFNATLAWLNGDLGQWARRLRQVVDLGPDYDWPVPLARQMLEDDSAPLLPQAE